MYPKELEHIVHKTMASWDGTRPAEVSPFLWTRIQARLFDTEAAPAKLKPAFKLYLGIWLLLFVAQLGVWVAGSVSHQKESTASQINSVFFSDDQPYYGNE